MQKEDCLLGSLPTRAKEQALGEPRWTMPVVSSTKNNNNNYSRDSLHLLALDKSGDGYSQGQLLVSQEGMESERGEASCGKMPASAFSTV